jgi:hypothetical protein
MKDDSTMSGEPASGNPPAWWVSPLKLLGLLVALGLGIAILIFLVLGALGLGLQQLEGGAGSNNAILGSALEQGAVMIFLAVLSFMVLVMVVVAMARLLAMQNQQNHPHALGLPAGSVRALIALAFLIFLAVLSIFSVQTSLARFERVGRPLVETLPFPQDMDEADIRADLEQAVERALSERYASTRHWRVEFDKFDPGAGAQRTASLRGTFMEQVSQDEASEISREVLTIIATALTAIVGFYFGSRSLADGVEQLSDPSEAVALELTLRRTRDRLRQLAGPESVAARKLAGWDESPSETVKSHLKRLADGRALLNAADEVLINVNSSAAQRKEVLQKMRDVIDDLQKLEATLKDETVWPPKDTAPAPSPDAPTQPPTGGGGTTPTGGGGTTPTGGGGTTQGGATTPTGGGATTPTGGGSAPGAGGGGGRNAG